MKFVHGGEYHAYNPDVVNTLQAAVQQGDYAKFKEYTTLVDQRPVSMIRDLLKVKVADQPLPLEQIEPLEAILLLFRSIPRTDITRKRVAELDMEFHDALFRAAHHQRLYRTWQTLRSQVMVFLLLRDALPDDYLYSWHRDHQLILDLLRARDVAGVMAASEQHICGAYERLQAMLEKNGGLPRG